MRISMSSGKNIMSKNIRFCFEAKNDNEKDFFLHFKFTPNQIYLSSTELIANPLVKKDGNIIVMKYLDKCYDSVDNTCVKNYNIQIYYDGLDDDGDELVTIMSHRSIDSNFRDNIFNMIAGMFDDLITSGIYEKYFRSGAKYTKEMFDELDVSIFNQHDTPDKQKF